jgi:hypothetical protein
MNTRLALIEAQRKILKRLAELENAIGDLYEYYASRFPATLTLWTTLVEEERAHALMLHSLERQLDAGYVFWNLGQFNVDTVNSEMGRLETLFTKSKDPAFTEREALIAASRIESSVLDSHFYSTVKSDSPEFSHMAKALDDATRTHVNRIQDALHRSVE